jgi:long-chain acyl-CoA synthetase
MSIIKFLEKCVEKHPTKLAVVDEQRSLTFRQLHQEVQNFSSSIANLNKKSVTSLSAENSVSFIVAYLGIINSGKIAHLLQPEISENNLLNQIRSSGSRIIICSSAVKKNFAKYTSLKIPVLKFDEISYEPKNDTINLQMNELAYLIYTSGTTAEPKGVPISHAMIEFTTNNIVKVLGYSNSDIDVLPLPLYHSFGLGCFHVSLCVGSTLVLLKNANSLEHVLESLKKYHATTLAAIPATLTKLLRFDRKKLEDYFANIRLIITNSTPIPKNTVQSFKQILRSGHLATYYGLTEASRSTFMIFDENNRREESVGRAAPGVKIKIVSESKNGSQFGEVWIKGNNVIKKYWNNNEADKNIVDGWLRTGDVGYFDEKNFLFLKGRLDDVINVGGEKVTPEEIEDVVKEVSGVEDAAAFGIHHEIFGQVVKLNVVKSKDVELDKSKILSHCIKNLEKFKIPTKIDFVESIPKTDYGKVKRFMLK